MSVTFQTRSCLPGAAVSIGKPGPVLSPVESFEHERSVEKARSLRKLLLLRQLKTLAGFQDGPSVSK